MDVTGPHPSARDALAHTLYAQGAYCGDCSYEGWDTCADCRRILRGYAEAAIREWVPSLADNEALIEFMGHETNPRAVLRSLAAALVDESISTGSA